MLKFFLLTHVVKIASLPLFRRPLLNSTYVLNPVVVLDRVVRLRSMRLVRRLKKVHRVKLVRCLVVVRVNEVCRRVQILIGRVQLVPTRCRSTRPMVWLLTRRDNCRVMLKLFRTLEYTPLRILLLNLLRRRLVRLMVRLLVLVRFFLARLTVVQRDFL